MTPQNLINSLAENLKTAAENYNFPAEFEVNKPISIYKMTIPAAEFENQSFYPLICIELTGIVDEPEFSVASVLITCGVYDGDSKSGEFLFILTEAVRQWILTHKIFDSFSLQYPIETFTVEKTVESFSFSQIFCAYQIPNLSRNYTRSDKFESRYKIR